MNTTMKIAVADYSAIIRYGVETLMKRIPEYRIQLIDIATPEDLASTLRSYSPDVLIINPTFPGGCPVSRLKEENGCAHMKCIALIYSPLSNELLREYDGRLNIYDTPEEIKFKVDRMHLHKKKFPTADDEEQQTLSNREKEIVVGVVKGMTNKEIADKLCLSAHTVITHRRNIARKLQIHSASGLTIYAIVNKLVELSDIQQE